MRGIPENVIVLPSIECQFIHHISSARVDHRNVQTKCESSFKIDPASCSIVTLGKIGH